MTSVRGTVPVPGTKKLPAWLMNAVTVVAQNLYTKQLSKIRQEPRRQRQQLTIMLQVTAICGKP